MVHQDELGKMLQENDLPRKQAVNSRGVTSKSEASGTKDRTIGNIGADAGRKED